MAAVHLGLQQALFTQITMRNPTLLAGPRNRLGKRGYSFYVQDNVISRLVLRLFHMRMLFLNSEQNEIISVCPF